MGMDWERPLMEAHAAFISGDFAETKESTGNRPSGMQIEASEAERNECRGCDILNIGFGLGLVDNAIQKRKPRSHTIVEAHPDVQQHMLKLGWGSRPGVRLIFARWQDALPQIADAAFDGIFWDTYAEGWAELREFHKHLPRVLKPGGRYSYFNGAAPES